MASQNVDYEKLRVLIVDDEPFIRSIIRRILVDLGCKQIIEAGNGAEAVRHAQDSANAVDIVLLDLQMPVVDGFQFLTYLRKDPDSTNKQLPVVVLSGHSEVKNMIRAAEIGIHGFAVKPVSKTILDKQISRALSKPMLDKDVVAWALRGG